VDVTSGVEKKKKGLIREIGEKIGEEDRRGR
jgi:hypothetical protein